MMLSGRRCKAPDELGSCPGTGLPGNSFFTNCRLVLSIAKAGAGEMERILVMLSNDELKDGMNFILKLSDTTGTAAHWIARFDGDIAARWYGIYYRSDWQALRDQGREVFRNRATEAEAERVLKSGRCVMIHTAQVKAEEIDPLVKVAMPLQPNWESDGGSLAPTVSPPAIAVVANALTT